MAESDESLWDSMMNINVKGTYFVSRAALPALRKALAPLSTAWRDAFPGANSHKLIGRE
jgi:NAD(P)-dependent dehydrogenase (short-subunit alcohol dehydrogenase family)